MSEDVTEIFAVVVEGGNQAPILMESEGHNTSRGAAEDRLKSLLRSGNFGGGRWFRGCVVRLEYVSGNIAVLHAMKGCQP